MPKPDLQSPEGRRAYRAELARVARGWRWTGLGIVALSVVGMVQMSRLDLPWSSPLGLATIAGLVVGWGLAVTGIIKRTRYHVRRLAGGPGDD